MYIVLSTFLFHEGAEGLNAKHSIIGPELIICLTPYPEAVSTGAGGWGWAGKT